MLDCVMWEGKVGKLQDGCLGGVVKTLLLFVSALSVNVLKNIVADDGFGFDSWGLKQDVVDMLFYIYAIYIRYIF